jgi:Protein of unknown function (DUF2690)
MPALPAWAATCLVSTCNGHTAPSYGCTADATVVDTATYTDPSTGVEDGGVQLYFSAACGAAWARVYGAQIETIPGDTYQVPTAGVYQSNGETWSCTGPINQATVDHWSVCDTKMVNDHNYTSYAEGKLPTEEASGYLYVYTASY